MAFLVKHYFVVKYHKPIHDRGYIVRLYNNLVWSRQSQHLKVDKGTFLPQEKNKIML